MSISTFWAGIIGFFKTDTANDIFDKDDGLLTKAGKWVNDFTFTDQERARFDAKTLGSWSTFIEKTLSENTERSKTRRNIAILWIKNVWRIIWILIICIPIDFILLQKGDDAFFVDALGSLLFSNMILLGTTGVIGFFFGPYMFSQHLGMGNKNKKEAAA